MNSCIRFFVAALSMLFICTNVARTEIIQFKVKLTFTGTLNVDSVWMGVSGDGPGGTILDNTNGFDGGSEYGVSGQWRESIAPPPGASGAYARFMDIPGSTIISDATFGNGLHRYDFRGKSGSTQVDTFAIQMRTMNPAPPPGPLSVGPLTISWPSDLILYGNQWELKKKIGGSYFTLVANMAAGGTSYNDPNTEAAISIDYLVIRNSAPPPCLSVNFSRPDIGYGTIQTGVTSSQTISVCNPCTTSTLTISSITAPAGFSVSPSSATIAPSACVTFTVSVTPAAAGTFSGTLIFNTSSGTFSIPVSYVAYIPSSPPPNQFKVKLTFTGTLNVDSVWMGVSGDGPGGTILDNTNGFDGGSEYGASGQWRESISPPPSPSGAYARFMDIPGSTIISDATSGNGLHRYNFHGKSGSTQVDTFAIQLRTQNPAPPPGPRSVGPLTISWPSDLILYGNQWELKKKIGETYTTLVTNMATGSTSYNDPNTEEAISIDYLVIRTSITDCATINLCAGWNLVSLPWVPADYTANTLFPGKFGPMFGYCCGTYCQSPILERAKGYWVNYSSPIGVTLCGAIPGSITISMCEGWNLIGGREVPVNISSLQISGGASIFGPAFRYNCSTGGYQTTPVINPGEAVWVYVTAACTITIP